MPMPVKTHLVVSLKNETNDLIRDTRNYLMVHNGVIRFFPPLSVVSHTALLANIDQAQAIRRANGDLMARVAPITQPVMFDQKLHIMAVNGHSFGDELWLSDWFGPDRLNPGDQRLTYTLDWSTNHRLGNYYN